MSALLTLARLQARSSLATQHEALARHLGV